MGLSVYISFPNLLQFARKLKAIIFERFSGDHASNVECRMSIFDICVWHATRFKLCPAPQSLRQLKITINQFELIPSSGPPAECLV